VLQGPIWGLVMSLDGLLSELVWVLDQVKDRPTDVAPVPAPEAPAAA
jgi:hypothetical protein